MKAVVVFDMPTCCDECKLHCEIEDSYRWKWDWCNLKNENIFDVKKVQDWCPLKPLPRLVEDSRYTEYQFGFQRGFNACVNEITGEKK